MALETILVLIEVQNQSEKYRDSSFGFGFSKLKKLEKQLDVINNNMNKNRNSALQNLIKNSILDNNRAYYSLQLEEYNNLLDKSEMNPKSFIIT